MEADLSHVVDPTVMGRVVSEETPSVQRSLLKMKHLRGGSGPLVLLCVRATTGRVSRHLTVKEMSNALDLLATLVQGLPEWELKSIMRPRLVPSKIRWHVAEAILGLIDPTAENEGRKRRAQFPLGNLVEKRARSGEDDESIISGLTMVTQSTSRSHASIKPDAAAVPTHLWDERLGLHGEHSGPGMGVGQIQRGLKWVRGRLHAIWCRRVARSFWQWVIKEKALCAEKGIEFDKRAYAPDLAAIDYALQSDWWEWKGGSAPFFWRWPTHCMNESRDGLPPRFIGPPPSYRRPQRVPADKETIEKIQTKLEKFRWRGYISKGAVDSLMSLFEVSKGLTDIRIVFDGTACGLNEVLWAPWFRLPTVKMMFRSLDVGYWSADNDFGEMLYNFWLHETLRNLCGVDLTRIFREDMTESQKVLWEQWNRAPMGLKPSPYQAVGGALNFRRVLLGDPTDKANIFAWAEVAANIPRLRGYVVGKPWVYKRDVDGFIASDVCIYVDNGQSKGKDKETAWRASSKFAKIASFLGLQDAAWKRMAPSQDSEPWFGAKASTTEVGVFRSVADERWMKMKRILMKV
jgi:hypothetical protein